MPADAAPRLDQSSLRFLSCKQQAAATLSRGRVQDSVSRFTSSVRRHPSAPSTSSSTRARAFARSPSGLRVRRPGGLDGLPRSALLARVKFDGMTAQSSNLRDTPPACLSTGTARTVLGTAVLPTLMVRRGRCCTPTPGR